jgi:hypothetical protein
MSHTLTSPDGDQWQVRRRWLDRPVPRIRRSLGKVNDEVALESGLEASSVGDSIPLAVGIAVAVALLVFILLPLIGVALEIVLLLMLLSSGIVGRVLLRRPWTIEAINLVHPQRSAAFAVKGWQRSTRAIDELVKTIPASGLPQHIAGGIPIAVKARSEPL